MRGAVLTLVLVVGATALAKPATKEEAQRLFRQGQAAYNLGKYKEAISYYEQTYRLMRHPAFLYNIGQAYRKRWEAERQVDLLRRSLAAYQSVVREDREGKLGRKAEQFVSELSQALAQEEQRARQRLLETGAAGEELRVGRRLLEEGHAADAARLVRGRARRAGTPPDVLAQAFLLLGKAAVAQSDRAAAVDAFRRALLIRPSLEPAEVTGPVREAFREAQELNAGARLSVTLWPPGRVTPGEPVTVPVIIEADPLKMIVAHELRYRASKSGAFSTVRSARGKELALPDAFVAGLLPGSRVELHVRSLDAHDAVLVENGTAEVPYVFTVHAGGSTALESPAWYTRWWVWTIVGAAAVAASTATYFAVRSSGDEMLTIPARVNP